MYETLKSKLLEYIRENNPDILFHLEQEGKVTQFLTDKVSDISSIMASLKAAGHADYIIEKRCMNMITTDLRPSKYQYIYDLLMDEFALEFENLNRSGLLQTEIINMIEYCQPIFDDLNFSEATVDNRFTKYAIAGMITEYLENNSGNERVRDELQQSAKTQGQY